MSAIIVRFPDMVCSFGPRGTAVKATSAAGRETLSDAFGLPAHRRTEINPILLNTLLRRRPDLLAYDVPHRSH
jgi:hypothetical protein